MAHRSGEILGSKYADHSKWFCFNSPAGEFWFDSTLQSTERYGLYGIPFLARRLEALYVFNYMDEIKKALAPFAVQQAALKNADISNNT